MTGKRTHARLGDWHRRQLCQCGVQALLITHRRSLTDVETAFVKDDKFPSLPQVLITAACSKRKFCTCSIPVSSAIHQFTIPNKNTLGRGRQPALQHFTSVKLLFHVTKQNVKVPTKGYEGLRRCTVSEKNT